MNEDLACFGCGYQLAALPEGSVCPECATPIAHSRVASTLEMADPTWLRRIHSGVVWLIAAFAFMIVFGLMTLIPNVYLVVSNWFIYLLVFLHLMVLAVACLRLTVQDPAIVIAPGRQPERWARVLILSYVAMMSSWYIWWPVMLSSSPFAHTFVSMLWTLLYVGGVAMLLIHLRRVAIRTPEPRAGDRFKRLIMWLAVAVIGETIAMAPMVYALHYLVPEIGRWVFGVMKLCAYVGLIRALIQLREALGPWIEKGSILAAASAMSGRGDEEPGVT